MKNLLIFTGGKTDERSVSLNSSIFISEYIDKNKFNLFVVEILKNGNLVCKESQNPISFIKKNNDTFICYGENFEDKNMAKIDCVFIATHGTGENGEIQGFCDFYNLKYFGNDLLSSAVTFDKLLSKKIIMHDFKVLPFLTSPVNYEEASKILNNDILFIKPNRSGSSLGCSKVKNALEFENAVKLAKIHDETFIAEPFVDFIEVSCSVIKKLVSPVGSIAFDGDFANYEQKYNVPKKMIVPAVLNDCLSKKIQNASLKIAEIFKLKYARIDFFVDIKNDEFYFNEVNSIPYFGKKDGDGYFIHTLKNMGYSFCDIVNLIIEA